MNYRLAFIVIVTVLFQSRLSGQTIKYSYDANGNRTRRTIVVEELQSNSVSFPVIDPAELKPALRNSKTKGSDNTSSEELKAGDNEVLIPEEGEIHVTIFPNPNKGILKIEIKNMPYSSRNEMRLYDLSGAELIMVKDLPGYSEADISRLRDGIYILRISINEKMFDFKVILNR